MGILGSWQSAILPKGSLKCVEIKSVAIFEAKMFNFPNMCTIARSKQYMLVVFPPSMGKCA